VNGKVRANHFLARYTPAEIEKSVLASEHVQKWLEGQTTEESYRGARKIVNVVI